jgi:transposase-like protein
VFKGRHFDRSVILLCVRWYLAYNLSLRNLEEMMAERGISVDHATIHRWVTRYSPELLKRFNSRKKVVTSRWHIDETYIEVRGRWMYLYRAIDSNGDTVEFWFSDPRPDLPTPVPETEPDDAPDLLPEPSEPPGDDVPKVG